MVYWCNVCYTRYNLYSGTIFQQTHLTPMQVVLLMRGIYKGESSKMLAAELKLDYIMVLTAAQANAEKHSKIQHSLTSILKPIKCFRILEKR